MGRKKTAGIFIRDIDIKIFEYLYSYKVAVIRLMQRFRKQYPHVKFIDFDVLRDTAGFHFLERGDSLAELRNNLNHSDIEITKRLYTEPKKKFYTQTTATKEETMSATWGIEVIK